MKGKKQLQGWSRKKKEGLILGDPHLLSEYVVAYRDVKLNRVVASRTSATVEVIEEMALDFLSPNSGNASKHACAK